MYCKYIFHIQYKTFFYVKYYNVKLPVINIKKIKMARHGDCHHRSE